MESEVVPQDNEIYSWIIPRMPHDGFDNTASSGGWWNIAF